MSSHNNSVGGAEARANISRLLDQVENRIAKKEGRNPRAPHEYNPVLFIGGKYVLPPLFADSIVEADGCVAAQEDSSAQNTIGEERTEDEDNTQEEGKREEQALRNRIESTGGMLGESALIEVAGIYIIERPDDGLVKIGKTGNFGKRFTEIRRDCASAGHPYVDPLVLFPVNTHRGHIEKRAHDMLQEYRTAGEWFDCEPRMAIRIVLDILESSADLSERKE